MSSDNVFKLAKQFTCAALDNVPEKPVLMTHLDTEQITKMICEELLELLQVTTNYPKETLLSIVKNSKMPKKATDRSSDASMIAEQADAFVDIVYYLGDRAARQGVDLATIYQVVHNANMQKAGPDGKFIITEGKIQKPPGWQEPDVVQEIRKQMS